MTSTMPENAAITFPWLVRGRVLASIRSSQEAQNWLIANGQHRAARILQKGAPIGASSTTDSDTATMLGAWSASMSGASVFFKLFNDNMFRKMPLHTKIGLAASSPTAAIVGEGRAAPVSRLVIGRTTLEPIKIAALLVATRELLLENGAEALFNKELKSVVGEACDAALVGILLGDTDAPATTIPSSGTTPDAAVADVRAALLALGPTGDASRVVALAARDVAIKATLLGSVDGGTFQGMTPAGGQLRGVNCLVSNGIPPGQLIMLDAMQIAAAATEVDVRVSISGDVEMSDAPMGDAIVATGTSLVSLFSTNSVGLRAIATIAAQPLRPNVCVVIENIDWGA